MCQVDPGVDFPAWFLFLSVCSVNLTQAKVTLEEGPTIEKMLCKQACGEFLFCLFF